MNFSKNNTLAEIVKFDYRAASVFEKYNIDFCCNGKRTIEKACKEKDISYDNLLSEIYSVIKDVVNSDNPENCDLIKLIDHILEVYHVNIRNMIPVILNHSKKVKEVHGSNHGELLEIDRIFEQVCQDLDSHMQKEELILFPAIIQLVENHAEENSKYINHFGSINNPISVMEREHSEAGNELYKIRFLSNNYLPPPDACATFNVFFQELKEFEEDLHRHIHLENNILFPKAIELENN